MYIYICISPYKWEPGSGALGVASLVGAGPGCPADARRSHFLTVPGSGARFEQQRLFFGLFTNGSWLQLGSKKGPKLSPNH